MVIRLSPMVALKLSLAQSHVQYLSYCKPWHILLVTNHYKIHPHTVFILYCFHLYDSTRRTTCSPVILSGYSNYIKKNPFPRPQFHDSVEGVGLIMHHSEEFDWKRLNLLQIDFLMSLMKSIRKH